MLDYDTLADQIVNEIPEEVFISHVSTFVDPAFAGGQSLRAVARRLRKYGHSITNIRSRLFGFENNICYLNHAKNKSTALIAQLSVMSYEDILNMTMKFDVAVGNPPFSKNNKGKGGTSIYHEFAQKAIEMSEVVAFVTPGSFLTDKKFAEMRESMNSAGVETIDSIPLSVFSNVNIIRPVYWIVGTGDKKVDDFFVTPENELFKKIINDNARTSFTIRSGRGDVSTSNTPNLSLSEIPTHPHRYVDRVRKEGPVIVYCNDKIDMKITSPIAVFAQRAGMSPKLFYVDDATSYSQNVMAIQIANEEEFDNLKQLFNTPLYKFLLLMLSGGKITTAAGFPAAFTKGKIERLPAVLLNKAWNTQEVYDHFGISKKEQELIEDYIA
jgi:hypothetical protein